MDCGISGIIRGAIYSVIPSAVTIISYVGMSISFLPYDIYKAYCAILFSKMIGFNVKLLLFFTAIIPILIWPILVTIVVSIAAPLGYFGYCFIETYRNTMNNKTCCLLETDVHELVTNMIYDFWNFNYRIYGGFMDELKDPNYNGHVYEISFCEIIIGLILAVIGLIVNLICTTIIVVTKCIPTIFKLGREITSGWCQIRGCLFQCCTLCWVVAIILMSLACIVAIPVSILIGMVYGIWGPITVLYKSDNILKGFKDGLKNIFHTIYEFDDLSNKMIFGDKNGACMFACFKCETNEVMPSDNSNASRFPSSPSHPPSYIDSANDSNYPNYPNYIQPNENSPIIAKERVDVMTIWKSFFDMCEIHGAEAINEGLCSKDDFNELEPYIIIGLPSLVIIRALNRSKNTNSLIMADKAKIDGSNCPDDMISRRIYIEYISILHQFEALKLQDHEYQFAEKWLVTQGDEDKCKALAETILEKRLIEIKSFLSTIRAMSINLSRLPPYHRYFYSSVKVAVYKAENANLNV